MTGSQRTSPRTLLLLALLALTCPGACDRDASGTATTPAAKSASTAPTTQPARPSVASLSPAATDLLIGMGAGGHIVAVSNWDADRPDTAGLPRVGDYRSVDRERLAGLRPERIVVQYSPGKMPAGLEDFARQIDARIVNIQIVDLNDVFKSIGQLGEAVGAPHRAAALDRKLRSQLNAVGQSVADRPTVRTFIARDETGLASVGGGNFVDDVLRIAGGENVLTGGRNSYPTVDRERLVRLDPEVILHLLPDAPPHVAERARAFWAQLPELRAVKGGRVYVLTDYHVLQPGHRIGDTAAQFAECLHGVKPAVTTAPTSAPATAPTTAPAKASP